MARRTWLAFALASTCGLAIVAPGCGSSGHSRSQATSARRPRHGPVRRPVHVRRYRRAVPILMYHEVRVPPPGAPNPRLFVSARTFRAQVRWLVRRGFHGITIAQLQQAWKGRRKLPSHPVVLSFDDGYLSVYRNVVPVLKRLHWPGVLNLALGNTKASPPGVTRAEVRRMMGDGWELASHTISHLDLTTLDPAALRKETAGARALIYRWFHVRPNDFCYPAGRYNKRVIAAVRRAGYTTATTVNPGLATARHPYELRRIRVEQSDAVRGLARTLAALRR
jgi:peptidoglycan/xylan/chitin deacetylase (PgdA/CDA1 family)